MHLQVGRYLAHCHYLARGVELRPSAYFAFHINSLLTETGEWADDLSRC
jgi:hypothetical protein